MTRDDLSRVVEIARASLPEAWTIDGFAAELEKPTSLALVIDDPIAGFAIASVVAAELEILTIAVDPSRRRAGHGRALLDALPSGHAFLEVRASNAAAIALYASAGFVAIDRRARYYADGEDAVVMARSASVP